MWISGNAGCSSLAFITSLQKFSMLQKNVSIGKKRGKEMAPVVFTPCPLGLLQQPQLPAGKKNGKNEDLKKKKTLKMYCNTVVPNLSSTADRFK